MIVDDDVFERMGAAAMFAHAGYSVLEADSADEALIEFEANDKIDLLFTDISMAGVLNGSDLANLVAKRWPRVGIITTSGRPRPEMLDADIRFHAKPYRPSAVLEEAGQMVA
jgi:CheY-like chemotaxis protein